MSRNLLSVVLVAGFAVTAGGFPEILWIVENHESAGNGSILNTGTFGYSDVAALAAQLGAANTEVDDWTPIVPELLAPYSLVVVGCSETGPLFSSAEVEAFSAYVGGGGRLFVMAGGYPTAGEYANAVGAPFGVTFDANPTMINVWATEFVPDPLTANVTQLIMCGPSFFVVEPPGVLLGSYGGRAVLARAPYGSGMAAFWCDDWVFYNQELGDADHYQFADNVLTWGIGLTRGDMNCDGVFDFADINPFVLALLDSSGYALAYPECNLLAGDLSSNGSLGFEDINPFVALLLAPGG